MQLRAPTASPAHLCPASCTAVLADTTASVQIELGCATRPAVIR